MSHLIKELKAIQQVHGYLPPGELDQLSERLRVPLYSIQGVATFYPHFRLSPRARLEVRVCQDVSCHLAGAAGVCEALVAAGAGRDGISVAGVACLGRCDTPVAATFNDEVHTGIDLARALDLFERAAERGPLERETRPAPAPFSGLDPYGGGDRWQAARKLTDGLSPEDVIATLKDSGLRGMGGAGFPTGVKWELVRKAPGEVKYVICNADESEPGTFKDRAILAAHPHLVIEGMVIAAAVVGARQATVYLRHEYQPEKEALDRALAAAREAGVLARHGLDLDVFVSPGGYICGEETALLEALEGKRAEPRNKPPFPGTHGLWGMPTLINNVETFAFLPAILLRGAPWFKAAGRNGASGLKLLALSGHVNRPGVYEVPLGIPADELIRDHGAGILAGRPLKAFAPGGASSGFLPAAMASTPLDFAALAKVGSMLGSGAVVAVAEGTCMLDLSLNLLRFFRNESCGKCVPCRAGTEKLVAILEDVALGRATPEDLALVDELAETMRLTSICGLGQAAPYPITSVLRYFRDEVDEHVLRNRCPSGICPSTRRHGNPGMGATT